jgi:hypothetical protein
MKVIKKSRVQEFTDMVHCTYGAELEIRGIDLDVNYKFRALAPRRPTL